tara:strand:+ start:427 stop:645 length:219 start_codon:yes stop_codon:yes gene_type:complete
MATTTKGLTVEKVVNYIKSKWQVFGAATLLVFILQLLAAKLLIAVLLGLAIAGLLPSDTVKKVTKKVTATKE